MKKLINMKRKNPNDATFRNINALKKRVTVLEKKLDKIIKALTALVK